METIDWQAYHDKSMDVASREQLESRMSHDAELRAEYEGFKRLVQSIASTRDAIDVPHAALQKSLDKIVKRRKRRWWPLAIATGLAFASYATFVATRKVEPQILTYDNVTVLCCETPKLQATFVNTRTKLHVGVLTPPVGSKSHKVYVGPDWARYEFQKGNGVYTLQVRYDDGHLDNLPCDNSHGTIYRFVGDGIGWKHGGLIFIIQGLPRDELWSPAKELSNQTDSWRNSAH